MRMPDDPDYFAKLGRLAPSARFIRENPGAELGRMSDMIPWKELRTSEFYRKIMKPEGWRFAAAMFFWEDGRFVGHLALNRTEAHGDFTDADMAILRSLYPDLRVAVLRVRKVEAERALVWNLRSLMSSQPSPLALLDLEGQILFGTAAFADALAQWNGVACQGNSSVLPDDLVSAVHKLHASWREEVVRRNPLKIDRSIGSRLRLVVKHPSSPGFSATLRVIENARAGFAGGQVRIELTRPLVHNGAPVDSGEIQTRLTPAQQRVGRLIVQGMSYAEAAGELGISENTVRNHLARIYKTLKINSRSQLAALLLPGANHADEQ